MQEDENEGNTFREFQGGNILQNFYLSVENMTTGNIKIRDSSLFSSWARPRHLTANHEHFGQRLASPGVAWFRRAAFRSSTEKPDSTWGKHKARRNKPNLNQLREALLLKHKIYSERIISCCRQPNLYFFKNMRWKTALDLVWTNMSINLWFRALTWNSERPTQQKDALCVNPPQTENYNSIE